MDFYGMVQFNLIANNPDEFINYSYENLYMYSVGKAIDKLPSPEIKLKFLTKKPYFKNNKNLWVVLGIPVAGALVDKVL